VGTPQAKTVLAVLLVAGGEVVSRDRIADEIWGAAPPASAKVQIQGLISQLRRVLPEESIITRGTGYLLHAPCRDDEEFTARVGAGRELIEDGRTAAGVRVLHDALNLWRGRYLADIDIPAVRAAAVQWDELRLVAIEDRIAAELQLGQCASLMPELADLIATHPFREQLRGQLMTALAKSGRIVEALQAYREWQGLLGDEFGVEPSPALRMLHSGILRAEPELRPTGYSAFRRSAAPCQLPADLADFVGRRDMLAELATGHDPVVVLTGEGGIGKTSAAVRLANLVRADYPDGQLFVSLQGNRSEPLPPLAALGRFLRALGVPSDLIPTGLAECADLFQDLLSGRRMLLVLDDAADDRQIRPLLPDEPGCKVIVTSRHALSSGRLVPVGILTDGEAMALLSGLVGPERLEDEHAGALVGLCGRLPLALRIAGGRLADRPHWVLSDLVGSLSAERDQLPEPAGNVAVRSSLQLGYRDLDPRQQLLFQRLGLLSAPDFSGWVAAALLDAGRDESLDVLVGMHMVQTVRPDRYRLHDLLRSFAYETAQSAPEWERRRAIERALGGWLWLAEAAEERLPANVLLPAPGNAPRWPVAADLVADPLEWFDAEYPALDAAIALAADLGMGEMAWELAVVCGCYFDHRGLYGEWLRCHSRALPAARAAGCDRGVAALLRGIAQLHVFWDNYPQASAAAAESLDIAERIGDRLGMGRAIAAQGIIAWELDQFDDSVRLLRRALAIFTEEADLQCAVQVTSNIGLVRTLQGRLDEAQSWVDKALRDCVVLGDEHRTANVLRRQAQLCLQRDDAPAAIGHLGKALEVVDAMRDQRCAAHTRLLLGQAHRMLGDHEAARNALRNASTEFAVTGNGRGDARCARLLGDLTTSRPII
jgi:DNA-binding SARP family transcriptional activator/tetratricopeptide (TPR) repeat protein